MLATYLLVAFRTIRRYVIYSTINVLGLSASMAMGLLMILFIRDQASRDHFHEHADRTYRIYSDFKSAVNRDKGLYATSPANLAGLISESVPGVEEATRMRKSLRGTIVYKGTGIPLNGFYADEHFLSMFSFGLQSGDPKTALARPNSVVLTPAVAAQFFGDANPVGEVLAVEGGQAFTVTGLFEESDYPSHIPLSVVASYASIEGDSLLSDWTRSIYRSYTYIRLRDDADPEGVQNAISSLLPIHFAERDNNRLHALNLQPIGDINFGLLLGNEIGTVLPRPIILFLAALALMVLLTACFNYVGLTVSRALTRAREVGLRKMSGASRSQVFTQFLIESLVISLVAVVCAGIGLVWLIPGFNALTFVSFSGTALSINYLHDPGLYLVLAVFTLSIALIAGLYPALYLSRFSPAIAVKGRADNTGKGGSRIRKALVIVQFSLSIIFIVFTSVMIRQSNHMIDADYGFTRENIINVRLFGVPYENFRADLSQSPNVEMISGTSPLPASGSRQDRWIKTAGMDQPIKGYAYFIDENFTDNLDIGLLAGTNLGPDFTGESGEAVLVNRTLLQQLDLGTPIEAIGKSFVVNETAEVRIAGVLADYRADVLTQDTSPIFLEYDPENIGWANVRAVPGRIDEAMNDIRRAWTNMGTVTALKAELFDSQIDNSFVNQGLRDGLKIVGFTGILALIIACLGLLGIASFNVERRTREISIRKVLGATAPAVVALLSREFVVLTAVASLIGLPLAWIASRSWLDLFAYRINLGLGTLVFGIGVILSLVLVVTGSQSVRAALQNPVDNLHDD